MVNGEIAEAPISNWVTPWKATGLDPMRALQLVKFVNDYRAHHAAADKAAIAAAVARRFDLKRKRSLYIGPHFAVRFSTAASGGFSNTVLSLSALHAVDDIPVVVCLVRPDAVEFLLANSTFLKKVSHSSHELRVDNVRGSFNGSDILRNYEGVHNGPENFQQLFDTHQEFTWQQNLERLVEATNAIAGTGRRFAPTAGQRETILRAPAVALHTSNTPQYLAFKRELDAAIQEKATAILELAAIENVNLRGNQIEQIITGGPNVHGFADMRHDLPEGLEVQVEIKTKLLDRSSAPKAYNIDKLLEALSTPGVSIAYCFVGVDVPRNRVISRTVSIFDRTILAATRIQFHWAGRNSRGVTQLTGDVAKVFAPEFQELIDVSTAQEFLERLLNL